jgi:malonate decarboxylase alpha subunit
MDTNPHGVAAADWQKEKTAREERLKADGKFARGKMVKPGNATALLQAIIRPGDRLCMEGDNQKRADFLAGALAQADPKRVHDLHIVQSGIVLPEHLDLFERGIATKLEYSYSGTQGGAVARALNSGKVQLGAIHTYIELFARYFVDLTPNVALTLARAADREGNLYMGPNTEDSPVVIEATALKQGIVVAQVNEVMDTLPRVDVPGDHIDFIVQSPKPFYVEPLFTRDPAQITETMILTAMMAIKGIYAEYGVKRLNHGIGFNTAAIELLLPTYADKLGLKGKICTHWALNPHPTLIPAIESGWVEQIHSFGSEVGMDEYMRARPDIYFNGRDGSMGSNRMYCQVAGLYATDLFIGSTLQIDLQGNSSTITQDRIAGFGGAPNMGCDAHGRRHPSDPWLESGARGGRRPPGAGARTQAGRADHRDVQREDGAHLRGKARQPEPRGESQARTGAGDDLRRRRDAHRQRGRHRQPAAVPHGGRAGAGHPRRRRLHRGGPRARPQDGGEAAGTEGHPASGRPRHQPARRAPEHARGAVGQGPDALVGQPVRPARQVPQLVGAPRDGNPEDQAHGQDPARRKGGPGDHRRGRIRQPGSAAGARAAGQALRSGHRHHGRGLRQHLEGGRGRLRGTALARGLAHLDQRRRRPARYGVPAPDAWRRADGG